MRVLSILLIIILPSFAQSQEVNFNEVSGLLIDVNYGPFWPGGDLKDRFGICYKAELGVTYVTKGSHWTIGARGGYLFGSKVKEDVLASLRSDLNEFVGSNNSLALIFLRQRGMNVGVTIGKIISLSEVRTMNGIKVELGAGYMYHKIRLQDELSNYPQVGDDYKQGYDRFTMGFSTSQFIGYQFLSSNRTINFYAGIEFIQGYTKSARSINYDTKTVDTESRLDMLYGFKIGWILPFYFGENADDIYY